MINALVLATSAAAVAAQSVEQEVAQESTTSPYPSCSHSVRKPWESLSCDERSEFLAAARALKNDDDLWGDFAAMHFDNNRRAHGADQFLPWHRWFLWVFEKELQRVSQKCITIPFWSWENDVTDNFNFASGKSGPNGAAEYRCDTVWSQQAIDENPGRIDFCTDDRFAIGQNGVYAAEACCGCGGGIQGADGVCRDMTFVDGNIPHVIPNPAIFNSDAFGSAVPGCAPDGVASSDWIPRNPDENECLRRAFTAQWQPTSTAADMAELIENQERYEDFRRILEGTPHAAPHNWVGGTMSSHFSPDDPIFFLHHANVDRLWALWQDVHDGDLVYPEDAGEEQYSGPCNTAKCRAASTADVGIDEAMPFINPGRLDFSAPGSLLAPTPRDMLASFGGMVNVTYQGDEIALLLQDNYNVNPDWVTPAPFVSSPPADGSCSMDPVIPELIVEGPVVAEPTLIVEEPVVAEPTLIVEEPVVAEPTPIVEEPVVAEPTPIVEEPVVPEPTPIVEEPPVQEPIVEEPPVQEPIVEEPPVQEPIVEEPPVQEPILEEPVQEPVCVDRTQASGAAWYDSDGPRYSCQYYADTATACAQYGASFRNFGMVANEACCVCGGGTTGNQRRSTRTHANLHFRSNRLTKEAAALEETFDLHDTNAILHKMHELKCRAMGQRLSTPMSWIKMSGMEDDLDAFRC